VLREQLALLTVDGMRECCLELAFAVPLQPEWVGEATGQLEQQARALAEPGADPTDGMLPKAVALAAALLKQATTPAAEPTGAAAATAAGAAGAAGAMTASQPPSAEAAAAEQVAQPAATEAEQAE
jgi:hypothetical protein